MRDATMAFPVERLLRPKSIAIVGVSPDPDSIGGRSLGNLIKFAFAGDVHLVSRTNSEVSGRPCVPTIDDLPPGIDAMVLGLPAKAVEDAVAAAVRRRVGGIVVFAAGFSEAGEEGRARQDRIAAMAHDAGIALLGPNTLGMTNYVDNVLLAFGPNNRPQQAEGRPSLAILSQSGAMAATMRLHAQNRGIFVSYSVATGNEAVTGVEDYLAALVDDENIDAIAIYAEQFRKPALFLNLAAKARIAGKPIVALHPGRSAKARESAASHTGALAGDYATMRALLASEAVIVVETLEELLDTGELLARYPDPPARGIGVVTDSGAFRGLSLDQADVLGVDLPNFAPSTIAALAARLPSFAQLANPLDITAQGVKDIALYADSVHMVMDDPNCGSGLIAVMPGSPDVGLARARSILQVLSTDAKPNAFVILGGAATASPEIDKAAIAAGISYFRSPERALRALSHVTAYAAAKLAATLPRSSRVEVGAKIPGAGFLVEYKGKAILAELGIAVPPGELARTVEEAVAVAERIGWPVVLKAQAAALPHKTEVSGVVIGIADRATLRTAWQQIHSNIVKSRPGLVLEGLLVEGNAQRGVELVVGGRNDPMWGPILVFGLGGIWTEALGDVRIAPADLPPAQIKQELGRLASAKLFNGFRGAPPIDLDAVAEAIGTIGCLIRGHREIAEIDINPLVAYPAGVRPVALDALISLV